MASSGKSPPTHRPTRPLLLSRQPAAIRLRAKVVECGVKPGAALAIPPGKKILPLPRAQQKRKRGREKTPPPSFRRVCERASPGGGFCTVPLCRLSICSEEPSLSFEGGGKREGGRLRLGGSASAFCHSEHTGRRVLARSGAAPWRGVAVQPPWRVASWSPAHPPPSHCLSGSPGPEGSARRRGRTCLSRRCGRKIARERDPPRRPGRRGAAGPGRQQPSHHGGGQDGKAKGMAQERGILDRS